MSVARTGDKAQPFVRVWKDHPDKVRFDRPIPIDVEADPKLTPEQYEAAAAAIEREVRQQLQVRVHATLTAPGTLPRSTYKTPLVHVRDSVDA